MLSTAIGALGTSATYTPDGGSAFTVTVIEAEDDEISDFGATRIQSNAAIFEASKADFDDDPAPGDAIAISGRTYTVKSVRTPDANRLLWRLECYPA